jgi:DNA primase
MRDAVCDCATTIEANKIKKDLLSANGLACDFFNYLLLKHPSGEICRDYAQKRKLSKEILEKFQPRKRAILRYCNKFDVKLLKRGYYPAGGGNGRY